MFSAIALPLARERNDLEPAQEKRMWKTLTSKSRKVLGWKENLVSTSYGSLEEQTDNLVQVSKACFVRFQSRTRVLIENCAGGHYCTFSHWLASFWLCPVAL